MLGTPDKSNPFAASDPFTSRTNADDAFETVDISPPAASSGAFFQQNTGAVPPVASISNGPLKGAGTSSVARERDLDAREMAIKKKEKELAEREAAVARGETGGSRKNWPRLPFVRPMLRHNISEDVPAERQRLVRFGYYVWILMAAGFVWNWIVILIMFIATRKKLSDWLFASLICGFGFPLSFWLWHLNLYKGSIRDTAMRWWWFFLWSALQPVLCGWIAVAPPVVGNWAAGGFTMITQFNKGDGAGIVFAIFSIVNMVFWGLALFGGVVTGSKAMKAFRNAPLSLTSEVQMNAASKAFGSGFGFKKGGSKKASNTGFGSDVPRYQV
jgi:hypothetical protein